MTETAALPGPFAVQTPERFAFTVWRLCAAAGAVYATAGLVFWAVVAGFLPAPQESLDAKGITAFFLEHETRIRVGMVGYIAIAVFYVPWSVLIARVMERIEGPNGLLNRLEFFGGIATTFVTLFSGVMWLAASFRTGERSVQDIQLLSDVGWFIFDMTFMVTSLQLVAMGTVILIDRRERPYFPKWLAWLCYFTAASFLPLVAMPFLKDGPFAWTGLLNYWVALGAFFVWLYVTTFLLFGVIRRIEDEELVPIENSL